MNKTIHMLKKICNYNRVVRERGRHVTNRMWRVGQEHSVIRIF